MYRIQRVLNLGDTPLNLNKDLLLYIVEFLEVPDRLKVELCLNIKLNYMWHYKYMFEHEHFYETHVSIMKIGDVSLHIRSSNYTNTGLTTMVTYKQFRKRIIHDRNIPTRAATRRVVRCIENGKLKLFRGSEVVHYRWLRRR